MNSRSELSTHDIVFALIRIVASMLIFIIGLIWVAVEWWLHGIIKAIVIFIFVRIVCFFVTPWWIKPGEFSEFIEDATNELKRRIEIQNAATRHPFLRRLAWDPSVAIYWVAITGFFAYRDDFSFWLTVGVAINALWFILSVFDTISGHRWLDWLYPD